MANVRSRVGFVLCINNTDCDDLERGKVYVQRTDASAKRDGYVRVVDESGEDYLYPEANFVAVDLPERAKDALLLASQNTVAVSAFSKSNFATEVAGVVAKHTVGSGRLYCGCKKIIG